MKTQTSSSTSETPFNFDENILPESEFESSQDEVETVDPTKTESPNDILPEVASSDDLTILGDEIPNA